MLTEILSVLSVRVFVELPMREGESPYVNKFRLLNVCDAKVMMFLSQQLSESYNSTLTEEFDGENSSLFIELSSQASKNQSICLTLINEF